MDNTADLGILLASRHPLLVASMRDEMRFLELVRAEAGRLGLPVWTWSSARGLARDTHAPQYGTADLRRALQFIAELEDAAVFVLTDAQPGLADPVAARQLRELVQAGRPGRTIVLTGPSHEIPPGLQGLAVRWQLRPPSDDELAGLMSRIATELEASGLTVNLDGPARSRLLRALRGLSESEAARLIRQAATRDGSLGTDDVEYVLSNKVHLFDPDGLLELVDTDSGTLDALGGMEGLKSWLRLRAGAFHGSAPTGLEPPRGVLLTGVPGCGKSTVAKTLAQTWGVPLILLDPARLYGKYVGESEQRLDQALKAVDAMGECVLWIDEIEKGFATGDADGGVSRRLLGSFLRWMQERPAGAFLVATANDVRALPPELLRKGRFDEVFFVDLPAAQARLAIFSSHLARRSRPIESLDIDALVSASEGYSGAEIEAAVVGALYRAHADGRPVSTDDLLHELEASIPISRARSEEIQALRAWAGGRAVAA